MAAGSIASRHEEQAAVKGFENFIAFVIGIAVFGAGTFNLLVSPPADPADISKPNPPFFDLNGVRTLLAVAWLCFILALAIAGYLSSIVSALRQASSNDTNWDRRWDRLGIIAGAILQLLIVVAFLFLSLALVAYVSTVGWIAVGFSCLSGVFVLLMTAFQLM